MAYGGRLISPLQSSLDMKKVDEWLWGTCALQRLRRTVGEAKQTPAKAMIHMESLSPTALPTAVGNVHGAQKYAQIGGDAAEQLLMSAVETWCLLDL
eukprot:s1744_g2.t1